MVLVQINKSYVFLPKTDMWLIEIYRLFFENNPECIIIHEIEELRNINFDILRSIIEPKFGFYTDLNFMKIIRDINKIPIDIMGTIRKIIEKNPIKKEKLDCYHFSDINTVKFGDEIKAVEEEISETESHSLGEIRSDSENNVLVYHKFFQRAIVINNLEQLIYNYRDRFERFAQYKEQFIIHRINNEDVEIFRKHFHNQRMNLVDFEKIYNAIMIINKKPNNFNQSIIEVLNYRFERKEGTPEFTTFDIYNVLMDDGGHYFFKNKEITFRELSLELDINAIIDLLDDILWNLGYKQIEVGGELRWDGLHRKSDRILSMDEIVAAREKELNDSFISNSFVVSDVSNLDERVNTDDNVFAESESLTKKLSDLIFGKNAIHHC
jgi:hypothetical protein